MSAEDNIYREYDGFMRSSAYNNRTYIDIETNRSVRPSFTKRDYTSFRQSESVPSKQKHIISMCMDAYDNVGIIRNIIDLMGDFACQGMTIVHKNKNEENFYRKWFEQVNGQERSERFLNYLYRLGNVIVRRQVAKITPKQATKYKKATAKGAKEFDGPKARKKEIPWSYEFLNPLVVDYKKDSHSGKPELYMNLNSGTQNILMGNSSLPDDIRKRLDKGTRNIKLDESKIRIFHYKKDDWLKWANPMIRPILDDIIMLEKMKLADLAALDGAISNVRLWTLGDLEHKIMPKKPAINKLRDILASNVGGGTMDLIWGPDLKFQESASQVYKFLGKEKYEPVLTSIYAGVGIPPTLTGSSGSSGFTNNYVALKTLIERLEYGRNILLGFWNYELRLVQAAMGFKYPPQLHFDHIVLSDEASITKLLVDLADRDIISNETLLERLGEMPEIESIRVKRENVSRMSDVEAPKKAGPYHNSQHTDDMAKLAITKDVLDVKEYFKKLGLPSQEPPAIPVGSPGGGVQQKAKPSNQRGRPLNSKDTTQRKQKRVLPNSKAIWALNAQKEISDIMNPVALAIFEKKNVRSLTKAEFDQLEFLKLCILTGLKPFEEISAEQINILMQKNIKPSQNFKKCVAMCKKDFINKCQKEPSLEDMRMIYAIAYSEII